MISFKHNGPNGKSPDAQTWFYVIRKLLQAKYE